MSIRVHVGGRVIDQGRGPCLGVRSRVSCTATACTRPPATVKGRLFALPEHLDRLERSASRIGLPLPARAYIQSAIAETMAAAGNAESRVRIMVTRGAGVVGALDLDPAAGDKPELVVIVMPRNGPTPDMYEAGGGGADRLGHPQLSRAPSTRRSNRETISTTCWRWARPGDGRGPTRPSCARPAAAWPRGLPATCSLWSAGEVRTPALSVGILDGITRTKVLELCR